MKGFTLIEVLVYIGISTILVGSAAALSLNMEKRLMEIRQRLREDKTADLIFEIYENAMKSKDMGIVFVCDQDGATILYPGSVPQNIGEVASHECVLHLSEDQPDIPRHTALSFVIGNRIYSENIYQ